jgi:TonB family protein
MAEAPEGSSLVRSLVAVGLIAMLGCRGSSPQNQAPPPESEAPVALNPDVPIAYPPTLYDRKVEGDVTLRLFVDSTGKLIPESTRVAEPSGYPALDSAALAGAVALRFAPAKRHGVPVATEFLQPVEFRQVGTMVTGTATPEPAPTPVPQPAAPPPARLQIQQPAPPPPSPPPPPPPPVTRPRPRPPVVRPDTTRADSTKARPDTTRPDTTRARTDTSAATH